MQGYAVLSTPLKLARDFLRQVLRPGDTAVDATVGKGRDLLFLTECVGEGGRVLGFDIQPEALAAAEKLGAQVYMPPLKLCGDNGAMIGAQGYYEYLKGNTAGMDLNAYATRDIAD